jgi:Ca2+:H+ antiporter
MVDSADEPPLSGHLHPWAKNAVSPSLASPPHPKPQATVHPTSSHTSQETSQNAVNGARGRAANLKTTEDGIANLQNAAQESSPVVEKGDGTQPSSLGPSTPKATKDPLGQRFIRDVKLIIGSSWINWLLLVVPVAIILGALVDWGHMQIIDQSVVFAINAVAIVPLASLLAFATESVASRMGDTLGALMNVTFGNAVELIIFIIALADGQVRVVQAAAVGSILSNLLIILGMSFLLGGLRFREQLYNSTVSQMSACLLMLSVISLLLPTAFHASFDDPENGNRMVLQVSRGTSIVLLLVYALYLVFSLKSHSFMYASTPQHIIDEEAHPGVLTQMLNSSDSSSSSSSDTDSDSSRSSYNTARRIKRAFRRKRRTSSPSSKAQSTHEKIPKTRRTPTDATSATFASLSNSQTNRLSRGSLTDEFVLSGDEADVDAEPRIGRRRSTKNTIARDFESTTGDLATEKPTKRSRRHHKHHKRNKRGHGEVLDNEKAPARDHVQEPADNSVRVPAVQLAVPEVSDASHEKRPFNFRNFSTTVGPAFPHHEAVARPLAIPVVRPMSGSRSPSRRRLQRSSSMPDMIHPTMSNDRAIFDAPHVNRPQTGNAQQHVEIVEDEPLEGKRHLSKTSSVVLLLVTTGFVAICAEFLVGSIDHIVSGNNISQAFLGLIILPLVGNAAEHVTAVTVAVKNKMDLAIQIALGSSIQVAILITPFMVVLGWIIHQDMSLYFSLFETVALFASAMIVGFLLIDGRSNYLEGALLVAAYIIIALAAFYYPNCGLSTVTGIVDGSEKTCSSA